MKKSFIIIICLSMAFVFYAQEGIKNESEARALEETVKTSGNYLYGEAVHTKKNEAEKIAKTILISEINKEALSRPEWQFAKKLEANNVNTGIEQIELPRGSRFRVIAFIKKDDVIAVFDKKETDVVLKSTKKEKEPEKIEKKPSPEEIAATAKSQDTETKTEQVIDSILVDNEILAEFIKVQDAKEAGALLTKYKKQNKLNYGSPKNDSSPEKSYWIVYNRRGNILGILDKSSEDMKVNLLTGELVNAKSFASTNYLWFQLLD